MEIQEAVKRETRHIMIGTGILVVVMIAAFFLAHNMLPDKIPFDYKVPLSGVFGGLVAVLNFFLLGLTVQKVAAMDAKGDAKRQMKASYLYRNMLQIGWVALAFILPCFNAVAGLLPLLFPGIWIKGMGIVNSFKK